MLDREHFLKVNNLKDAFERSEIAELDDMISTCMQIDKKLLEELGEQFKKDHYVDWNKRQHNGKVPIIEGHEKADTESSAKEILENKLL
mgnify:CR=1 FL=1